MNKSRVVLVRCESYDKNEVLKAVSAGIGLLGGVERFVKHGEKIVIKPNVLIGSDPEKCVTTHPAVFRAVGMILKNAGATVLYGDSPCFGKSEPNLKRSGLKLIGDELGMRTADFDSGSEVSHKSALLVKKFIIANGVLNSDGLVSLPKLKTHGLTRFTGAVKNQFGCVPGLQKGQYHVKMRDFNDFSRMLIDINTLVKPRLFVMDGIMAMEGNGPRTGKPKRLNVLLFSVDPVALDATACRIINLNPEFVPTSKPGEEAGLGTYHSENIEIIGENLESFIDKTFEADRRAPVVNSGGRLGNIIKNSLTQKPVIEKSKCTECGTCIKMCPVLPKAVDWIKEDKTQPPQHKYNLCIRCYCCQETCPEGAISIEKPFFAKIIPGM